MHADRTRERISRTKVVGEQRAVDQPNQQNDAHIAVPLLTERQRFGHLGERLYHTVDLGSTDAHATGIERGVAATVDDQRPRKE